MNYDVFFFEAFEEEARLIRQYLPEGIRAGFSNYTIQEYGDQLPAKLISTRVQSVIPPQWAPDLSGIISRSTGYEHLLKYQEQTGVAVPSGYLPLYCNRAVAEHGMMLWMALLRKLPRQTAYMRTFKRNGITGLECERKTLLVVGVGHIGYEVVKIGRGLNMEVFGVDLIHKHPDVDYVTIEEGLEKADIIVCAMNQTKKNYGYFSYDLLKKAKPGVIFVNVSRGELSHSGVLLQLIEEGHLGGVGLDAFNKEEVLSVHLRQGTVSNEPEVLAALALLDKDNVICTPHNAFNTAESTDRKTEQSVRQAVYFLQNDRFLWPIPEE